MEKRYPFKFLDAYRKEDFAFFFGREEEIEALYRMVFQTKILVVYGTSGTGKTSLIQCGLASKFKSYDWLALYVRRGSNLIASLDKALCDASDGVFEFAERLEPDARDLPQKIEAVYRASFKPVYLIFDQFEELYVLGDAREQQQFVQTVQKILEVEQPVKIIISIREEYLGHLYTFERAVPGLMRKKLRVEPMHLDKVESVIRNVGRQAESNVSLQAGEEPEVAEAIFEKIRGKNSLTIELPYLQVFLDKLYLHLTGDETRRAGAVVNLTALQEMGDIGDVLRDFLDEQVIAIARALEELPNTVWKILSPFVTLDGTKEPLSEAELQDRRPDTSQVLLTAVLQALVKGRILRYTEHDERYEIAHDALAKQVAAKRSDEEIALLEVQRLIKSQVAMKAENREYFSEKQLGFMERYLSKFRPDAEEQAWIEQSRANMQAEKEERARRDREKLEKAAEERRLREKVAQAEVERSLRRKAEEARFEAEKQRSEADEQRSRAEQKTKQARQLTRLAVILSMLAVAAAFWAFWLKQKAETATAKAKINIEKSYQSDIQRLELEIEITNRNIASFREYEAGDDVILYENSKKDSLSRLQDSLEKRLQSIKK